jgi:hypothetical protein
MAQVKPDFTEALDFEPLTPDTYAVVVSKADPFDAKSGLPMMKLNFSVTENKNGHQDRVLFRNIPLKGKGAGFLRQFLEAVNVPEDQFTDTRQVMGKRLRVKVESEEYEGSLQSRVTAFYKI